MFMEERPIPDLSQLIEGYRFYVRGCYICAKAAWQANLESWYQEQRRLGVYIREREVRVEYAQKLRYFEAKTREMWSVVKMALDRMVSELPAERDEVDVSFVYAASQRRESFETYQDFIKGLIAQTLCSVAGEILGPGINQCTEIARLASESRDVSAGDRKVIELLQWMFPRALGHSDMLVWKWMAREWGGAAFAWQQGEELEAIAYEHNPEYDLQWEQEMEIAPNDWNWDWSSASDLQSQHIRWIWFQA